MKREVLIHFTFLISFFIFISIFKRWFNLSYWPFWLGGVLGTILPDIDHLIYIYFLRPQELSSQRASLMMGRGEVVKTLSFLAATRSERKGLIFHTATFQLIFLILTFLVLTSSSSLLGRGIVLALTLHLVVDQAVDLMETGGLTNWFRKFPFFLDAQKVALYFVINLGVVLIFGFLL